MNLDAHIFWSLIKNVELLNLVKSFTKHTMTERL